MHDSPDFAREQLFAHVDWVRRLAGSLVRSADAADDVAQETWRVALEHPPRHGGNLRHWLALAARNVARKLGVQDRRHRAAGPSLDETNESSESTSSGRVVRPDLAPSAAELVERAQLHRRVVDAVLGLAEPYRSALLFRYFEDLATGVIAARQGVPVETVRTWLKRGLAQLRQRLAGDLGLEGRGHELRRALAPLLAAGAGVMVKSKLAIPAIAVLLVALGGAGWLAWNDDRATVTTAPALAATAETEFVAPPAAPELPARVDASETTPSPDLDPQPATTPRPTSPAVSGVVRTRVGDPVADAVVLLGREIDREFKNQEAVLIHFDDLVAMEGPDSKRHQVCESDEAGRFEFEAVPRGTWVLAAVREDLGIAFQSGVSVGDDPVERDLVLEIGTLVTGRIFMPNGAPCAHARVEFTLFRAQTDVRSTYGHSIGALTADASGEYRTIALPYQAIEIEASSPETPRLRTAVPKRSARVDLPIDPLAVQERRIDLTLDSVEALNGRLRLADGGVLAERCRATFREDEVAGTADGALGVYAMSSEPTERDSALHTASPRSALGTVYFNGPGGVAPVTWISGTHDLEAATYSITLIEPGMTHIAVTARKKLLGWAEIPSSRDGPDVVLDLRELPPPLGRGKIRVQVVDEITNAPRSGGHVIAGISVRDGDITTESDSLFAIHGDGTAEFDVRGGEIRLWADIPGFVSSVELIVLKGGADEKRTLVMSPVTRTISGTLTSRRGGNVLLPRLAAYRKTSEGWTALASLEPRLDSGGRFELPGMPDGELILVGSGWDFAPTVTMLPSTGDADVSLVLDPGSKLSVSAVARDERSAGTPRCRILDERRVPVVDCFAGGDTRMQDEFRLHPGVYELQAYVTDYEPNVAQLRIEGDTTIELGMHPIRH